MDILAIAKEVQPLGSVKRKSDGADLARRDIVLVDQRHESLPPLPPPPPLPSLLPPFPGEGPSPCLFEASRQMPASIPSVDMEQAFADPWS